MWELGVHLLHVLDHVSVDHVSVDHVSVGHVSVGHVSDHVHTDTGYPTSAATTGADGDVPDRAKRE